MNAIEVIESYVTEVATRLPRRQRNDVAFELRALLGEELQGKAEAAGRDADAAMALELVRGFGRPEDIAARYRPTLTIIDPADGHAFLRLTWIGLAIIWGAGLLSNLRLLGDSAWDVLTVLGRWWGGSVLPSLWWPGVLVAYFGASAWSRRRTSPASDWKPRAADRIEGGRSMLALGIAGMLLGSYILVDPHSILDFFWGGNAAPAAYQALTYTDSFLRLQAPILLVLVLLNIPLAIVAMVSGRHSPWLRRVEWVLAVLTCAAMVWTALDGPILMSPAGDQLAKALMLLIVAFIVVYMGVRQYRSVSPSPDRQVPVPH